MTQLHEGKTIEQLLEIVDQNQPCETCNSEREITWRSYDGERTWQEKCPDCRKGNK